MNGRLVRGRLVGFSKDVSGKEVCPSNPGRFGVTKLGAEVGLSGKDSSSTGVEEGKGRRPPLSTSLGRVFKVFQLVFQLVFSRGSYGIRE